MRSIARDIGLAVDLGYAPACDLGAGLELRQVGAGSVFGLGEEGRGALLNQAVQRGLFRAVALVVDRGAIRRPLGLPANGLHAGLPKW